MLLTGLQSHAIIRYKLKGHRPPDVPGSKARDRLSSSGVVHGAEARAANFLEKSLKNQLTQTEMLLYW